MYSKQKGLTLIELMVTISILIILSTVGVPSLTGFIRNTQFDAAFNSIADTYAYARQEAVHRSEPVRICPISSQNPTICLASWSSGNGMLVYLDSDGSRLRTKLFDEVATLDWNNGTTMLIRADGSAKAGTVKLTRSDGSIRNLVISSLGRAAIRM